MLGAIIAALGLGVYYTGRNDEAAERKAQDAQDYIEGRQDVDDAKSDLPDRDDARRGWLSRFAN